MQPFCRYVLLLLSLFTGLVQCQRNGDIRLVGSQLPYEGRVEVYYNGLWGTVCDDRYDLNDANVICRQLNFTEGADKALSFGHQFGHGSGQIWMDGLECRGTEKRLEECVFNGWGIHDCSHKEDAAVICKYTAPTSPPAPTNPSGGNGDAPTVRIACPGPDYGLGSCESCNPLLSTCSNTLRQSVMGVVERYISGEWYPIPRNSWNTFSAKVVCGQLGYPQTGPIPSIDDIFPRKRCGQPRNQGRCNAIQAFKNRLSQAATRGLSCSGSEAKIEDCFVGAYTVYPVNSVYDVATIQCYYDNSATAKCATPNKELYRLRGGPAPWIGRVEVKKNNQWGSICDLEWSLEDAHVVCRNLGFGSAKKIFTRAHFGRGSDATHYSGLRCRGNELNLASCQSTPSDRLLAQVTSYCYSHSGDVGVECNVPSCRKDVQSRLTPNNVVEVKGHEGWGRLCFGGIRYNDAHVICRETSVKFAARFLPVRNSSYNGISYVAQYACTGDELYTLECSKTLVKTECTNYTQLDCVTSLPDLVPRLERFRRSLQYYRYVDRLPMYYLTCALEENCLASTANNYANQQGHVRRLLRFDSLTMNYGTAVFLPNLQRHQWDWHACHQHYHSFEAFINYDMLDQQGNKVSEGHKASFCLEDSFCETGGYQSYRCSTGHQGISVNCGDLYARHLDCQWIDITDLSVGNYVLRLTVNKDHLVAESDYHNNYIQCEINFNNLYYFSVGNCTHSDH